MPVAIPLDVTCWHTFKEEEGLMTERESDRRLANFFEASGAKAQP